MPQASAAILKHGLVRTRDSRRRPGNAPPSSQTRPGTQQTAHRSPIKFSDKIILWLSDVPQPHGALVAAAGQRCARPGETPPTTPRRCVRVAGGTLERLPGQASSPVNGSGTGSPNGAARGSRRPGGDGVPGSRRQRPVGPVRPERRGRQGRCRCGRRRPRRRLRPPCRPVPARAAPGCAGRPGPGHGDRRKSGQSIHVRGQSSSPSWRRRRRLVPR